MRALWGVLILVLFAVPGVESARADGAVVIALGEAGPFEVTVLVSPQKLRVGRSQWSVLVRNSGDQSVVLDAEVEIRVMPANEGHTHHGLQYPRPVEATRTASKNRLLYTNTIDLASPGIWIAEVQVRGRRGEGGLLFELPVLPAVSPVLQHWRAFTIPPLALALFALHQFLVLRQRRKAGR